MVSSVPVVEGVVVTSGIVTMDVVAGRQMTDYLAKLLNEQDGVSISKFVDVLNLCLFLA